MGERHVVVGAGPVGLGVARLLAGRGEDVALVSRSGAGPDVPGARREAADAADGDRLVALTRGADVVYNCVNPPSYPMWATFWPPVAAAFLRAAEETGATLVTAGALYPYGPLDRPMVEGLPDAATTTKARIRAGMWAEAKARHEAGRIRAVEVRGSDYVGPGISTTTGHVARVAPAALAGRTAYVFGRTDQPHSFTDVRDVARALVAVAGEPDAWGRVWHAPTNPARTQRGVLEDVAASVGRTIGAVRAVPHAVLAVGGVLVPMLRELRETEYQFARPYVLDSSAIRERFGLSPTPWEEVCRATAENALAA
ncbi:NAD-dependent epimerase/dehydratase family protein [Nocardioides anomalus]|uniref:NAD-dependent epimerase/dehydratase family protein n=1 Tax=Nocardioides anomalus TaxID=2712223 RepID=A0A6G6WBP6_9ACTN|nr:NAD-dependent epimerase/dehydratase family protein [Nocardioides anomalus]QIG42662.1 NAD-dependent epimerase/dehydratase family protein [Nocardioides anomalus]